MGYVKASLGHDAQIGSGTMKQYDDSGVRKHSSQWRKIVQAQGVYYVAVMLYGELQQCQAM